VLETALSRVKRGFLCDSTQGSDLRTFFQTASMQMHFAVDAIQRVLVLWLTV